MSKKILSAVLAIAMVVSLCASLFTVSTSAATNYEADRKVLKEAIYNLFVVGPDVDEETRQFLIKAEILTKVCDKCDITDGEVKRSAVFDLDRNACERNHANGAYDGDDLGYFFKDETKFDKAAYKALILEAATAYYFGQNADFDRVDDTFNAGRNDIVKSYTKKINDYVGALKAEIGEFDDKPADYATVYKAWVETAHQSYYNPNFGVNPFGNEDAFANVAWYDILKGYNMVFPGWYSFSELRADATSANLLNAFERLYRAAQTNKVEKVLFYDFVIGDKADLENAWKALKDYLMSGFKWAEPTTASAANEIKAFNNLRKVVEFFDKYIIDAYQNIYTSTNATLFSDVTMAKMVIDFVKDIADDKEALYIYAIGAEYFNNLTDKIVAGIATLDPAAALLALADSDIATGVAAVNNAKALLSHYSAWSGWKDESGLKKECYDAWVKLNGAMADLKVILPYNAESAAVYTVPANTSEKIDDIDGTDIVANDAIVITFAPNYFAYTRFLMALEEALEIMKDAISKYNGALEELPVVSSSTTLDKAALQSALESVDFLVGKKVAYNKDSKTIDNDATFEAIASPIIIDKFIPAIVSVDRDTDANGVVDDKAYNQMEVFKVMYDEALDIFNGKVAAADTEYYNKVSFSDSSWDWETGIVGGSVNGYAAVAEKLLAFLPYLTAELEELINIYSYEANVLACFFGIPEVVLGEELADYQDPANYVGYAAKAYDKDLEEVTVGELLEYLAEALGAEEIYLKGYDTVDLPVVKEILAEINGVIAWYNENLAGKHELPVIEITTQDIEDMINIYIENEDEVKAQIKAAIAEVEAALSSIVDTVVPNETTAIGYALVAYGLVNIYNGYAEENGMEEIVENDILQYVGLSSAEVKAMIASGNIPSLDAIKDLAQDKIDEVIENLKAQLINAVTPEALYAVLVTVNDILEWYNTNIAGEYTLPEISALNEDVYVIDGYFNADSIWEAIENKLDLNEKTGFFKENGEYTLVTDGAYYDMMMNYFKLYALCAEAAYGYNGTTSGYTTYVNAAALNEARNAFIASVKDLLTDDRGDELIDEFSYDLIEWVNNEWVDEEELGYDYTLAERLSDVFGKPCESKALTLPTDAAEPYLYYNFTLKHVAEHDIPANKYSAGDRFESKIYNVLNTKSEKATTEAYNVSEFDREWANTFNEVRKTAGYVLELINNDGTKITSDIPLWKVLAVIEALDEVLDAKGDHTVGAIAAYKAAVLDPAIAAASGKNVYDYVDTDASHKVWANYEAAYAAAVAAKYDTRMPKSEIDAIVETLNKAVASLELVKKPESSATVADLEAKIAEAEALVVKADDLDTANKVARLDDLKNAIADAKQFIVDLKYVGDMDYNTYDIEAQIAALQTAMDIVVESQTFADDLVSYLTFVFNAVQAYYSEYTEESFAAFSEAWQAAQKVAADTSLKASAYVAARASVAAAYDALELKPEPTMTKTFEAAVAKLAELKAVSTEGYTAESVAAFNAAVAALEAGINEVAADDALLELIANAYIAKASLSAEVDNPVTCD